MVYFTDRRDGGQKLVPLLAHYKDDPQAIVLGLPRGGVVTAYEVAVGLHLPLDIIYPRKIGAPFNPEYAIGAVTETGQGVYNESAIESLGIPQEYLEDAVKAEIEKINLRLASYRKGMAPRNLKGKTVILVDDGLATGATMHAAILTAKAEQAKHVVVAIPVSPPDTYKKMKSLADEVVCIDTPSGFYAVGQYYYQFDQTNDDEVIALLHQANQRT